jgi:hypothetical protein
MAKLKSGTRIYGNATVDNNLTVGSATSTGTASQPLQVTGGAYVSNALGVGNTLTSSAGTGQIIGGFGGATTAGTLDWNHSTNARSGNGYTLLLGNATNGPGASYPYYYHSFSFEYNEKDGSGNLTQLAIPYANADAASAPGIFYRGRFGAVWASWFRTLSQPASIVGVNIDSTGNLLINSTTATGTASQRLQVTGGAYVSGNLGIGTTNPSQTLHVQGNARVTGSYYDSNNNVGTAGSVLSSTGSGTSWVAVSGGVTVSDDTTTNAARYVLFDDAVSGNISAINVSSSKLQFNPSSGTLSATAFTSLSDKTMKKNIRPIQTPIELTKQLKGVRYDWIDNNSSSIGVIAQEIEQVLPEVVTTNSDGTKSVSYGNIIGLLIEAIKEQQVRIEEMERKLNA